MESKKRKTLSERMNITLTEEQDSLLKKRAAKEGMSVSAYVRSNLRKDKNISSATNMNMILELRDVGSRLKKHFDDLREHGISREREENSTALLVELMEILERIDAMYSRR